LDADGDRVARFVAEQDVGEGLTLVDPFAVDGEDDVADLDPGGGGRTVRVDLADERAVIDRQLLLRRHLIGHRRRGDAEVGVNDPAVGDQLAGDLLDRVDRDREEEPLRQKAAAEVLPDPDRVDPDHPPGEVDQRPARVAGVDRRVVLDQPGQGGPVGRHLLQRAAEGADDALGDGVGEGAEGRTEREHRLPRFERVGVAEGHGGGHAALDPEDGEVADRVGADDGDRPLRAVGEDHLKGVAAFDDVGVGDDVTGGVDDEAGAGAKCLDPGRLSRRGLLVEDGDDRRSDRLDDGNGVHRGRRLRAGRGVADGAHAAPGHDEHHEGDERQPDARADAPAAAPTLALPFHPARSFRRPRPATIS
jgi:hypothetical protein